MIAVLARQSIPKPLILREGENLVAFVIALGTVQAFSLIGAEKGRDVYEMDHLVHLFVRCKAAKANILRAPSQRVTLFVVKMIDAEVLRAHFDERFYKIGLGFVR